MNLTYSFQILNLNREKKQCEHAGVENLKQSDVEEQKILDPW